MSRNLTAAFVLSATLALAQSDSVLLFSECSDASSIKRVIQSSDVVEVRHSLTGGAETCYSVSVAAPNGETVEGFLLGPKHPAVVRFESQERTYIAQALTGPGAAKPPRQKQKGRR
jgi:hypothetical protein